jgi:hypothetical protein
MVPAESVDVGTLGPSVTSGRLSSGTTHGHILIVFNDLIVAGGTRDIEGSTHGKIGGSSSSSTFTQWTHTKLKCILSEGCSKFIYGDIGGILNTH